jgi:YD repeat-containing protein
MEMLGGGGWVAAISQDGPNIQRRLWRRFDPHFGRGLIGLLCILLLLACGVASAQSTSYVYDANGRVVAVTANNGTSVQYGYNPLGHTNQISSALSPGQLAIFAFAPTHGVAGTEVTVEGQGFSGSAANDSVSFNGTTATVLSASATQLVVNVPDGATTGPISVTVSGQTASSTTPFVVDDTGVPPTISQVSPAIVAVGGTVTVTGTHLDPLPAQTAVQMGGHDVALSAASDAQLQFVVPSTGTSGYVVAQTAYGQALSPAPILVLPAGVSAASVVSSGYATVDGASVNLNIGAAGQTGAVLFNATVGSWLSLQASNIVTTASNIAYTIYAPGNQVILSGIVSTASPSIHLPQLTGNGTYLVIFQPDTAGAQLTVTVQTNQALTTSVPMTVVTTVPAQSQRVLFPATAGESLVFEVLNTTTSPASQAVTYTVYTPSGVSYTNTSTASTGLINLGNLPTSGTYQIVIAPGGGVTGTMQVEMIPSVAGTLLPTDTSQSYATTVSGENAYLSFTANLGDNLDLTFNNVSGSFNVSVFNAAGTQITSFSCAPSNPDASCMQHLWYLATGTYSVVAVPSGGTISFNVLLQPDVVGPALVAGTPVTVNLSAGQAERVTFNANAGDSVSVNLSAVSTTPAGQYVYVNVYCPDTGPITTDNHCSYLDSTGSSTTLNLANLPATGTYTLVVYTVYGEPASAQLTLVTSGATLLPTDMPQSYATTVSGQNAYLSFTANLGDNLDLAFSNVSGSFNVSVFNAAGTQITSFSCAPSNPDASCMQHLWYLAAGTYSVVAVPSGGTISFNALLQPDVVGPALVSGTPVTVNLSAGQAERVTFNANAGDSVALNLSAVSTTPAAQYVYVNVYCPGTSPITTDNHCSYLDSTGSSTTLNLSNISASGTYTLVVYTVYGEPASAQLTETAQ